jgi:hypothetical protein
MHIEALTAGFLNYDFYAIPDGAEQRRGVFRNIQTTALAVVEIFKFPVEPSHLFSPSQLLSVAGWIDTQRLIGLLGALSRALFLLARFFFQDRFFRYRERMPEGAVKILELVRAIATGRYGRYRFGLNLRFRFRVCLHLVSSYRCLAVAVHPIYSSDARFISETRSARTSSLGTARRRLGAR